MRKLFFVFCFFSFAILHSQELNCTVNFNTDQVTATNQKIFITLKKSLTEFINNTKWSGQNYKGVEKIDCSFFFTITEFNNIDQFVGTLQVQVSRPIFNSNYNSPILNINDKDISFNYTEFQNFAYDINSFDSNLISLISFYSNMIIGVYADTFSVEGGSKSLENAQTIVNIAQQSQIKGWSQSGGNQNRFFLVNDMLSPTYFNFRKAMYQYHLRSLDGMADNPKVYKENIGKALELLSEVGNVRPNSYLIRVFFDAKADELLSIYTDGPKIEVTQVINYLNSLSPTNSSKWSKISY